MRRAKFVGRYGNLIKKGFEYSCKYNIMYLYRTTEFNELMIQKSGGIVYTSQQCMVVLDQILELIDSIDGTIPDKLFWSKSLRKVVSSPSTVHWSDLPRAEVHEYLRQHNTFPPYEYIDLYLPKIDMPVIYQMYKDGDIVLVEDDISFNVERILS